MRWLPSFLQHRLAWPGVVGLFLLLTTPMVFAPFISDDYFHLLLLGGHSPLPPTQDASLFGLFSFIQNDPQYRQALMLHGALPWWTGEHFYFSFWRPLAEVTHWLDYQLAPSQSVPAHLHNLVWFVLLALLMRQLMQQLQLPPYTVLLAFAVFMLDGSHAATIEWIANRNAIMAAFFALAALRLHIRFRQENKKRFYFAAMLSLLLAAFCGEAALAVGGFFFAYAVLLDKAGPCKGIIIMLPYAVIMLVWLWCYQLLGFGADGSAIHYVDPFSMPLAFIRAVAERLPVYVFSGLGIVPAELYPAMQFISPQAERWYLAVVLAALLLFVVLTYPLLRHNKTVLFFLLGALISIIPFSSLVNQDRLLLIPSIGFSVVIASVIDTVLLQRFMVGNRIYQFMLKATAYLLLFLHLLLSPVYLFAASVFIHSSAKQTEQFLLNIEDDVASVPYLIILESSVVNSALLKPVRFLAEKTVPEQVLLISNYGKSLSLRVNEDRRIVVRREEGFAYGFEQSFRDIEREPFVIGDVVESGAVRIVVRSLNEENLPLEIEVELLKPVEHYQFVAEKDGAFVGVALPVPGTEVQLR